MALTMRITLRRLGQYAHLWENERTELPWSTLEDAALSWLESRYAVPDLRVILSRTESSIEERQQQRQQQTGSGAIVPAEVTLAMTARRALALSLITRERVRHKWTAEEDAALRWLAERYSILDLQMILCRPMHSIERRLLRLDIDHPGIEQQRRERQAAPTITQRVLRIALLIALAVATFVALAVLSVWLSN